MTEVLRGLLVPEVLPGVGPEDVAHGTVGWRLLEPVQLRQNHFVMTFTRNSHLPDIIQAVELWTETSVNTQELFVHQRRQGKTIESIHAGFVDVLGVFDLACIIAKITRALTA